MKLPSKIKLPKYKTLNKKPLVEEYAKLADKYHKLHNWAKTCQAKCEQLNLEHSRMAGIADEVLTDAMDLKKTNTQLIIDINKKDDHIRGLVESSLILQLENKELKSTWWRRLGKCIKKFMTATKNAFIKAGNFIKKLFTKK